MLEGLGLVAAVVASIPLLVNKDEDAQNPIGAEERKFDASKRKPAVQTIPQQRKLVPEALIFAQGYWYAKGYTIPTTLKDISFSKNLGYAISTVDKTTHKIELSAYYQWTNDLSFWPYGYIDGVKKWEWTRVNLKYMLCHAIGHVLGIEKNADMPAELRERMVVK